MSTDIKHKVIDIGIGTLVGIIASVISTTILTMTFFNDFDKRILTLENESSKGGRFTAQDGRILEQKIEYLDKNKAEKSNMRVIETKLANIETMLLDLKTKIK